MKIETAAIKYKGADKTIKFGAKHALVGPVFTGKSSIVQAILQGAADFESLPAMQVVPNGQDKAEVLLKTDDGAVLRWTASLSSTGLSAKTEREGSPFPQYFPQIEFGKIASQGPEVLFRNLIRRFGDSSLLNTLDQALAISNDLTAEERTIWGPMVAGNAYPTLVDVFEHINSTNQSRGRMRGQAQKRADEAHAKRKDLGVTESFANAAAKKIKDAQADLDFWSRLATADLKKYGIKVKGKPEDHCEEAEAKLKALADELGPVMEFEKLSEEYREQSKLARELQKQSDAAKSIRAAVKRRMDECLEAVSATFSERMASHLPKDWEASILSVSKGVAFGLKTPEHKGAVQVSAASGFEKVAYLYALFMAWGEPEKFPPIIVLDTEEVDASNAALTWLYKKLASAQKKGQISQVIIVVHDDRRDIIPKGYKVTELKR